MHLSAAGNDTAANDDHLSARYGQSVQRRFSGRNEGLRLQPEADDDADRMSVPERSRGWRLLQTKRLPGRHMRREAATARKGRLFDTGSTPRYLHRATAASAGGTAADRNAGGGARLLSSPVSRGGHLVLQCAYRQLLLPEFVGRDMSIELHACRRRVIGAVLCAIGLQVHQKISERLVRLWRDTSRMARRGSGMLPTGSRGQLHAAVYADTESAVRDRRLA